MPRTVVITGASRGLGLALVREFAEHDDKVFALSRTPRYWKSAKTKLGKLAAGVTFLRCDLTREAQVRKLSKTFKRVDILINNAGAGGDLKRVEDLALADYESIMQSNLTSAFLVCKHFVPIMRKQGSGVIVNVSSMAGQRAVPRLFAYSASKFGMLALSQCVAKENADKNLVCFTACPGGMNTEMRVSLFGKEDAAKQQSPEFVAAVIRQCIDREIEVESGGDIVIRHGKVTAVHPCPGI